MDNETEMIKQQTEETRGALAGKAERGFLDKIGERFEPALDKIKDLAISAGTGLIGELILKSVSPTIKDQVAGVIDEVASALTGKPVHLEHPTEPASADSS